MLAYHVARVSSGGDHTKVTSLAAKLVFYQPSSAIAETVFFAYIVISFQIKYAPVAVRDVTSVGSPPLVNYS